MTISPRGRGKQVLRFAQDDNFTSWPQIRRSFASLRMTISPLGRGKQVLRFAQDDNFASWLSLDAGSGSFHDALDFVEGGHGGVAGGGHGEGSVGAAAVDGPVGAFIGEEAVDEAGGEGVAAAYAVEDFEVGHGAGFVELALVEADGAPVVDAGRFGVAEGGGYGLEVGVGRRPQCESSCGRRPIRARRGLRLTPSILKPRAAVKSSSLPIMTSTMGGELAVDFGGLGLAADGLPEGVAVVEVVGDDGAVLAGGDHGFLADVGGGFGERAEDAAGVEPAGAFFAEDLVPVDVAGLELGDGGVAAVGAAEGCADAEAALGEVEAVASGAAYAVVFGPA